MVPYTIMNCKTLQRFPISGAISMSIAEFREKLLDVHIVDCVTAFAFS
jgi:hypothetical protein